ncbi:MAG: two component transcriptional regulator, winged helix family [Phenylobacterium sp.]|jgi:two-component system OmpR family response regulator|nr:two component transcriptional regulator, winged helix family [Phenylobacterium sp.]
MATHAVQEPTADAASGHAHQHTLLVVDDDVEIRTLVAEQLGAAGYLVLTASDGPTMNAALDAQPVDLIILDLNLPGDDGLTLCRESRSRRNIPIIMLTARGEPIDRIIGLEVGADDYISKPFDPRELTARVRSVMRRAYLPLKPQEAAPPKRAVFRGWTLDFENRRLADSRGRVVMLSGSEYSLLKFFVEHANQVLTREQLLTLTSQPSHTATSAQRIADLQISRLRQKLDDDARASELIMTVRGQGYVLAAAVTFE